MEILTFKAKFQETKPIKKFYVSMNFYMATQIIFTEIYQKYDRDIRHERVKLQNIMIFFSTQKQPSRGVFIKRCSENMQQIYRRTPTPKCDFNKVAKQLY